MPPLSSSTLTLTESVTCKLAMNAPAKPASMELKTLTLVYAISLLLSFIPPGCGFFGELSGNTHLTSPAPKPPDSSDLSPIHSPPAHQVPAKGRNPAAAATPPTSASSPSPPPARRIPATPPSPTPTHRTPATPSHSTPPSPTPTHRIPATPSHSTLDPKQLLALQSLGISTSKDPCSPSSPQNATVCDSGEPFRHVLSLQLRNCSDDIEISPTTMKALNTLRSLAFINCPVQPVRLPAELITNLKSFTCVHSLRKLTGVWLSRMGNLTDLRVEEVIIHASGLSIILSKMKNLRSVTISRTNLTGYLPRKWHLNITAVDLSGNELRGRIPIKITHLSELKSLNLSSNKLTGSIPSTIGDLLLIRNISLASNSLSGPIPSSMAEIPSLVHLDLSGNQFNGSVPRFLAEMKDLKYLNLENNNFQGPVPFNTSFIKKLTVFKVSGNSNLCYNHSIVSSKLKLGIARCDRSGFPIAPPDSSSQALSPDDSSSDDEGPDVQHKTHKHGPRNVVLGVAIALSSIIFLIIFFVLLSKCCKR